MELPEYLERVWEVVGREALGTAEAQARNGAAGALEEDARLTALFLWTLQSTADGAAPANGSADEDGNADDDDERRPAARQGSACPSAWPGGSPSPSASTWRNGETESSTPARELPTCGLSPTGQGNCSERPMAGTVPG